MKFTKIIFLVFAVPSLLYGQNITSYQLTDIGNSTLLVGSVFDMDGPGPLVQDNSTISLLVPTDLITDPTPLITSIQDGAWTVTATVPSSSLMSVCGGAATGYDLIQVTSVGQANLGTILAGVPEDLFTITFTGSSPLPIYAYDPAGSDPLSACLVDYGVDNTASIDIDGNEGPAPTIGYSFVPGNPEGIVLPIILTAFTAQTLNNTDAQLNWTTASEINSSHFDIQRSIQGVSWITIDTVAAAGNSRSNQFYNLTDKKVFDPNKITNPNFYYRLKMVDIDGYFEYSDVRHVKFENVGGPLVGNPFPNPTLLGSSSVQLYLSIGGEANLQIDIYDFKGSVVSTNTRPLSKGINTVTIGTGTLSSGIYLIKLTMEDGASFVRKLTVQ